MENEGRRKFRIGKKTDLVVDICTVDGKQLLVQGSLW